MKTNYSISRAPSGIFYLWYYDRQGKRQKLSTGRRLKAEAKEFAVKFLRGEVQNKRSRKTVRTVLEFKTEYLDHCKNKPKRKTYLDNRSCFNEFLKWLKNDSLPLREVKVKMVQDFIDYKQTTKSQATARRIYTGMCAAFHIAQIWEYIETNPWKSVKKPKLIERHPLWLTVEEFHKLNEALLIDRIDDDMALWADKVASEGDTLIGQPLSRRKREIMENKIRG